MKKEELEFNQDTSTVFTDWTTMNTISQIPFSATFTHKNQWVTVQLVNESDVLKLADIFAEMLKKNGIDCTVYKNDYSKEK